jgi:phospholipid-binding lipoprotein MlaA
MSVARRSSIGRIIVRGQALVVIVSVILWLDGVANAVAADASAGDLTRFVAPDRGAVRAFAEGDAISPIAEGGGLIAVVEEGALADSVADVAGAVADVADGAGGELENVTSVEPSDRPLDPVPTVVRAPLAQAAVSLQRAGGEPDEPFEEYDPWIKFNEKTFDFNYWFDRRVLKPVAKAYDKVVPDPIQVSIRNAFDNVGSVRRILNATFQGRFRVAGVELGRFLFNTVVGVGGLFDVAKSELGLEQADADTGQTFGVWGAGPGPYLVVPLLPPLTVRDAFGFVGDVLMNPLTWFVPTAASIALTAERTVNERSLNLELFENVEETVLDLYSSVRNGYLQRRHNLVEEGRNDSVFFRR